MGFYHIERCAQMVQEGTPIEEAMEEVIGCGTTCMSRSPSDNSRNRRL